ncbi:hypothetical protein niasHS_017194 [Heterodera schachtii]|uniref:long-chain-fatty-acid--CoA ligase n=1 Tax=Heterodera schachtii TaxID=97005 RepID=A0ABD2HXF3_HETSC
MYCEGGSVGFFRGDIRLLADDIKTLRPTVLPVVPRVLNRIYDKVFGEANKSVFTRLLFDAAVGLKTRELNNWIVRNNSLLDQIVFKKVREAFGGRVKLMVTGSAPLSETVLTFMRCATGAVVCEGYGQTECVAAATGECVAPEKIELIYMNSKYVAQCFVHGESLKTCLVAVVVPDFDVLPEAAKKLLGIACKTMEELCRNEQVKVMVMEDIHEVGKKAGLFTFEQAKDIYLYAELFTVENDLLTPTMKNKRPQLMAHFKDELCKMYEKLD